MNESRFSGMKSNGTGVKLKKFLPKESLMEVGMLDEEVAMVEIEPETSPPKKKKVVKRPKCDWTQQTTQLLLELYEKYLTDIGPTKQFKSKAAMWKQIADEISLCGLVVNPLQCENRYKTIFRRQFVVGNKRKREIDDDLSSVEDLPIGESSEAAEDKSASHSKKERKTLALSTILYKIHKEKEANRERRHQEKLDLIMSLLRR